MTRGETFVLRSKAYTIAFPGEPTVNVTRDGLAKQFANAKTHETRVKVAGLDGRRVEVTGARFGVPTRAEIDLVWDAANRQLITVTAATTSSALTPAARAFLSSLASVGN